MNMNSLKKIFCIAALFSFILFLAVFCYFFVKNSKTMSDLADSSVIEIAPGTTIRLDSGWEAFEDKDLRKNVDLKPDIFETGNYFFRLKLKTRDLSGENAFFINHLYSASSISVNGKVVYQCGVPGVSMGNICRFQSRVVPYIQDSDDLEIIIHISNYGNLYGGSFNNWISYGRYEDIAVLDAQGRALDFVIFFGFIGIGFFHLFNYFYQRKKMQDIFIFLAMFVFAFLSLFTGRVTASNILPLISGTFIIRFQNALAIIAMPLLMNYFRVKFPDEFHKIVVYAFGVLSSAAAVCAFFIPLPVIRVFFIWIGIFILAGGLYMMIALGLAVKRGRKESIFTLIGFLVLAACAANDILYSFNVINTISLIFTGVFIFAIHQTCWTIFNSLSLYRTSESALEKLHSDEAYNDNFLNRNAIELEKPIRNVVELGESLLKGSIGPLNSEQIATLSLIISNGVRLSNMVDDIIGFSKIKEGSMQLNIYPVDLFKLSRKVINSCEAFVAVKDVELKSHIRKDTPLISADEQRFEQILYNIVSNSIRHTEKGSIVIDCAVEGDEVEIIINVTGSDLNEEEIKNLFNADEHKLADNIDNKEFSDLSLAMAHKLVDIHSSEISAVSSTENLEYRFKIGIWDFEADVSDEEALEMDALVNLQPILDEITSDRDIEVVIAGKDVEELQILKSQLSSMNYSVVPMTTGSDLLGRVEESMPNLIVIDVRLPDMSGYEVCTAIRQKYSKDELPVILVINKEDVSDIMEGLTSGANDFLTRPYLQEEFLTRVNTHLQLSRISTAYSRYVPTEFLNALGKENILDVALGDQVSREMTILFVDIRAFTNLSENMTPEENFKFINSYLSRFSPMITNNGGFVDKYIGDAIMALFPERPENALAAAKEMIDHINVYNGHRANCGYKPIKIGIGIHTGSMILGIIGDEKRRQGTVISDAVNLASRIQDVTKLYNANIVVSQDTFVKLENPMDYNFRFLGRVRVKGKDKAVALFEIFDADIIDKINRKNETKVDFEEAIIKFSRRDFEEAKRLLDRVVSVDPEDLTAKVFMNRIEDLLRLDKKNFLTSL